jgi:hypothetical protein
MNLPIVRKSFSAVSKAILVGVVSLCFAGMVPSAFAQRGGGGHVGGGEGRASGGFRSAAGSFSGGARGSVGSAGRASGGAYRSGSGAPIYASGSSTRGYSRQYFVAGPASHAGVSTAFVSGSSATSVGVRSFAANNYFWQAPPRQGRSATVPRPFFMPPRPIASPVAKPFANPRFSNGQNGVTMREPFSSTRAFDGVSPWVGRSLSTVRPVQMGTPFIGMTATPFNGLRFNGFTPFMTPGSHPIGPGPCFGRFSGCGVGFFGTPFFNPFFFGFGSGPCFEGGFGCGFGPFGFGDLDWGMGLFSYGYGNGWFYPTDEEPPAAPENPVEDNQPPNYAPEYYFVPAPGEAAAAPPQPQQPVVKLVLKDGTIFGVYSYWLQNNQLFYITTYNIETSIPIDDLDLQKTVDLNSKLGVNFTLSAKPADQQQPQPPDMQPDTQ